MHKPRQTSRLRLSDRSTGEKRPRNESSNELVLAREQVENELRMTSNVEGKNEKRQTKRLRLSDRVRMKGRIDECNEFAVSATTMWKGTKAIRTAMNFTVTMIADEINVTTMTNLDR